MVDLATHEFDIEPMKTKKSKEALQAMKNIFKRTHLKQPKASLRTDNGTEFMEECNWNDCGSWISLRSGSGE